MQVMVEHFCSLTESLAQQNEKIRQLMATRGIPLRGGRTATGGKDEKKDMEEVDDMNGADALASAAIAASGALGLDK